MDYNGIPYKTVEVNPLTKKQISFSTEHKKVPIATINGNTVFNSADIIAKLKSFSSEQEMSRLFTSDTEEWMKWSETKLAVLLYPNITRSFAESWDAFSYVSDVESWSWLDRSSNRVLGPIAMSFANGRIKAKYNIWDERKDLKELLQHWTETIAASNKEASSSGPFLHGAQVTMPDLMVYGVLHSIEGLETFSTIMHDNDALRSWYGHVQLAVNHCGK
jgi:microsomal prostaglandin-E synthase 2